MINGTKSLLWAGASALALGGTPGVAQGQEVGATTNLDEIIVTARKVEERLQDIPVAVTALGSQQIEDQGIAKFDDIALTAPNVTISSQGGQQFERAFVIRGVLSRTINLFQDGGVGLYLDGVYIGRSAGSSFDVADIERVEVLRGPQGTLFGKNSTAGAISFTTKAPSGEFGVKQTVSVGNYDAFRTKTSVDLPALGPLSARVTYVHQKRDGYIRNLEPGVATTYPNFGTLVSDKTLGSNKYDALVAKVRLDAAPNLTLDYTFDYTNLKASGDGNQLFSDTLPNGSFKRLGAFAQDQLSVGTNRVYGHNLTVTWEPADDITVKSVTAHRKVRNTPFSAELDGSGVNGFSGSPVNTLEFGTQIARSFKQFSEELQVSGKSALLDWIVGGIVFTEKGSEQVQGTSFLSLPPTRIQDPATLFVIQDAAMDNKSYGLFGQATFHATEQLNITAGLRQSWDKRRIIDAVRSRTDDADFSSFDWLLSADYRISPDVMVYAKASTGYLSGGTFNARAYKPEKIRTYEMGVKSEFLDRRVRLNAAAFYSKYKDMQIYAFLPPNGVEIFNAGKADITGFEVELTALPVPGLLLNASYGLSDVDFKEFIYYGVDTSAVARARQVPKQTLYLSAQYETPLFDDRMNWRFQVDGRWQSRMATTTQPIPDPIIDAASFARPYWVLNARMGLEDIAVADGVAARISLWCRNFTNKTEKSSVEDLFTHQTAIFTAPRTYGVDVSLEF